MKVSIIIPCYNGEMYLDECLNSVRNQSYKDFETIVINDGSTDNTEKILQKYNDEGKLSLRVIHTENLGGAGARNIGLSAAKGEYVQFLDVDDLLFSNKLSHQISLIEESVESPTFIAGAYKSKNVDGQVSHHFPVKDNPWAGLISSSLGITSANLFQKKCLDRVGGFNEDMKSSQEYELMFRLMQLPDCLITIDDTINTIKRDINPKAISNANEGGNAIRYILLRKKMKVHLIKENMFSQEIQKVWSQTIFHAIKLMYDHNPSLSRQFFRKYLGEDYIPDLSGSVSGKYRKYISIFGYSITQKMYSLKKRLL